MSSWATTWIVEAVGSVRVRLATASPLLTAYVQAALVAEFAEGPQAARRLQELLTGVSPLLAQEIVERMPEHYALGLTRKRPASLPGMASPLCKALAERLVREAVR